MGDIAPFYIKQANLQPYYYAQVKDGNGDPIDITGAVIAATVKNARTGATIVDASTPNVNISSAANGTFEYKWQSSDTANFGKFYIEFEVTPTTGGKFTVPADPDERAEVFVVK